MHPYSPPIDCPLCPRLCAFREQNRAKYTTFYNNPVPSFGALDAEFLVVGLAPGLKGANQTGRPFTGDYAGIILYNALLKYGFARGDYLSLLPPPLRGRAGVGGGSASSATIITPHPNLPPQGGKGFHLINCRITNAVRCVPQENKPEPSEIKNCNDFLKNEIAAMLNLKIILSLGLISHNAVLKALGLKAGGAKFAHAGIHKLQDYTLINSYHCSRYNINTGRLTQPMFDAVIEKIKVELKR